MANPKIKSLILILIGLSAINGFVVAADLKSAGDLNNSSEYSEAIIALTNTYRSSLNLNGLTVNSRLTQAAINKASDMLKRSYFSHTGPDGQKFSQWVKDINYDYFYVGENLAIDFADPEEAFDAWLKSEKHRQNIERAEFQEIGVACIKGRFNNRDTWVIVQLFGTRVLGENELFSGSFNGNSGWNNYFYGRNTLRPMTGWTLSLINILLLACLSYLFYQNKKLPRLAEAHSLAMLRFTAKTAKPEAQRPEPIGNKQKYSKNDYSGISGGISKPDNRPKKRPACRLTLEANQLHRRRSL